MSIESRLDSLKRKHGALEEEINAMRLRPQPDESQISSLKREKLRLKEEIAKVSASTTQH